MALLRICLFKYVLLVGLYLGQKSLQTVSQVRGWMKVNDLSIKSLLFRKHIAFSVLFWKTYVYKLSHVWHIYYSSFFFLKVWRKHIQCIAPSTKTIYSKLAQNMKFLLNKHELNVYGIIPDTYEIISKFKKKTLFFVLKACKTTQLNALVYL